MELQRPVKRRRIGNSAYASFSTLPNEIMYIVFEHLDVVSRIRLRRVSKQWNSILRDSAVWQTIKLTQQELMHRPNQASVAQIRGPFTQPLCSLTEVLSKAGVFKHVNQLNLEGDYDLSDQKPHGGDWPFPPALTEIVPQTIQYILESRFADGTDFEKLERIVVRKSPLMLKLQVVEQLCALVRLKRSKLELTIESGSVVIKDYDSGEPWHQEIEIPDARTFRLSGRMVWLERFGPVVQTSEEEGFYYDLMPLELAEFIVGRCNAVPAETVAQLGEIYSELLKGREGLVIRRDLRTLFDKVVVPSNENDVHDPDRKHRERCKGYDFNSIDNWYKYALVYYTKPRNCYKLPGAELPPLPRDL